MASRFLIPLTSVVLSELFVFFLPSPASNHIVKPLPAVPDPPVETHHPKGWRFTMPKGDSTKGKETFRKFECYYCHEVRGEEFPYPTESAPELSQMGPMHPVEFFAESIMHPDAVSP